LHPEEDRTGEYKLYNDLIWQFAAPSSTDAAWPRWQYQLPTTAAPAASLSAVELTALTERLFQHPVMEHWQLHNSALLPAGQRDLLPQQELVMALLKQMERGTDGAQLSLALTAGLRVQASWLYLAGEQALAEQCATLALQLARLPITQNPVLAYMLGGALAREQEKP
jgi:hypothetical protein